MTVAVADAKTSAKSTKHRMMLDLAILVAEKLRVFRLFALKVLGGSSVVDIAAFIAKMRLS